MAKVQRLKQINPSSGSKIAAPNEPVNYEKLRPKFSLEYLQQGSFCFSTMQAEDKKQFAESLFKRRSLTWEEIKKIDRHGLGTEKIARDAIKAPIPGFITDDVNDFLALRFSGLKPMVGFKKQDVFYILWFDHCFKLYNH
ncbi:hypothetical protein KFZ76_01620 [Methylovulum psychrotolerans]|uniref:hypothetical protein n=1 Tax=Methylovulum psychrotolerans TaxID=1704499 RepID=UPI001BFF94B9|nr:hypothetical protein [Methylovulum psychrotolerans]MBT9096407.1 hypothetical protein [Methylovulum psychrotolerans]